MTKPFSDKLKKVTPYVPGEQSRLTDIIKLNANENPYPPSPKVMDTIKNFDAKSLALYPDASSSELVCALAKRFGLSGDEVFVGNGSDDVIALCYLSFFCSDKPILFPDITYSFYPVWCDLLNVPFETVAVDDDFCINPTDYYRECGGVIIPNPNAPTGIAEGREFIEDILRHNADCIVIIDEAYVDFCEYSCVSLINKYDNLIVTGTFSKSRSLAGLRVGYAFGNAELIALLNAVKNSYNSYTLDAVAIKAATASVLDEEYFVETIKKVKATRERSAERLRSLDFKLTNSGANFLFATHDRVNAKELFEACREQKIFIRYFNLPRIDNHLRITVGTDREMDILLDFIEGYIGGL